jgi:heme-degrading monooxygenase HmoA
MAHLLVRHRVQDFKKWKPVFDEDEGRRKAGGSQGCRLFRSEKDPNELIVLCEWKDLRTAHQFAESEDLRQKMERAGVIGKPEVYFLDEI